MSESFQKGRRGMKIIIGNDHGGYELKLRLLRHLESRCDIEIVDIGCDSEDIVRYPLYAAAVSDAVAHGEADRGILICSTGIGMSLVANRYQGVRATLCTSSYMGKMARMHNDSNILCLGGRITGVFEALEIVDVWLDTDFEGGRHCISLELLRQVDEAAHEGRLDGLALKETT